jgi:hypothetical protein
MPDISPQFENSDLQGSTTQFTGVVGVTAISLPPTAGTAIAEALVRCPSQTPNSNRLLYSFDGGANYFTLSPGEFVGWSLKGGVTQVLIRGSVANVQYEVMINREPV